MNCVSKKLADGTRVKYYYAWKGGPRLEGQPGSPEFLASYSAALGGSKRKPGADLQSLIDRYLDSGEFDKLAEVTKSDYRYQIKRIEAQFSDLPIAALGDRSIRADFLSWRDQLGKRGTRQADLAMMVLARIISWGFDRGIAPANPCQRMGKIHKGTRRDKVWTPEQEAAFMEKAPKHLRLPVMLALWTGQRRGDLLRLKWSAYDGSCIRLKQGKTRATISVPVGRALKQELDAAKAELTSEGEGPGSSQPLTILTNTRGAPWTGWGFSASFRKACKKAGVFGVTFHDLRGTAVSRMAEAECSVPEIATITGHSLKDVETILDSHYFKRDSKLAASAIRKLERRTKRPTNRPTGD